MAGKPLISRYGRYDLKAAVMGGTWVARAFLRGARPGHGFDAEATGATGPEAMVALETLLRDRDRLARAARRVTEDVAVPGTAEYRLALAALPITQAQWAMLRAHAAAGPAGLTAGQLAMAAGYADFSAANLHYGMLGRLVADNLAMDLPERPDATEVATRALGSYDAFADGVWRWVIYPELAAALLT